MMFFLLTNSVIYMWDYYSGPMYSIDRYIKVLNEQGYDKVYHLLDKSSLEEMNNKQVLAQYYERFYAKENKLVKVSKVGWVKGEYVLEYQFTTGVKKESINLVQNKEGWRILFPFEFSTVQIKAPNGAKVSLGGVKLVYEDGIGYKKDKLLPGKYMLEVEFPDQMEEDYHRIIEVPQSQAIVLPYTLGAVQVVCAPYLEVHMGQLTQTNDMGIVNLRDVLAGKYDVELVHPEGYLETVSVPVEVSQGSSLVEVKDYTLSSAGSVKWQAFLKEFYTCYEKAIVAHTKEDIGGYFTQMQKEKQTELFNNWYIADKDITNADVSYKPGEITIDAEGRLHSLVTETVELTNKEYDELEGKEVNRVYKVIIKWQTTVDISSEDWKITDRVIKESVVAFKDLEGKWIQY